MSEHISVSAPVPKVLTAWAAALGLSSWSDFAAALAAFYSLLLITEWWWKRFWRPWLETQGILKPTKRNRRRSDRASD